jgi:hypothetical protein
MPPSLVSDSRRHQKSCPFVIISLGLSLYGVTQDTVFVPASESESVDNHCLGVCYVEMVTYQHKLFGIFRTASTHCISLHIPSPSCWQGVKTWLKPGMPAVCYSRNRHIRIRTSFNTKIHVTRVRWSQTFNFGTSMYTAPCSTCDGC